VDSDDHGVGLPDAGPSPSIALHVFLHCGFALPVPCDSRPHVRVAGSARSMSSPWII
jgi:hypothetical protein